MLNILTPELFERWKASYEGALRGRYEQEIERDDEGRRRFRQVGGVNNSALTTIQFRSFHLNAVLKKAMTRVGPQELNINANEDEKK